MLKEVYVIYFNNPHNTKANSTLIFYIKRMAQRYYCSRPPSLRWLELQMDILTLSASLFPLQGHCPEVVPHKYPIPIKGSTIIPF